MPEVAVRIKDEELSDGSSMEAECLASGNPPVTKYEWRYNGNILDTKNSSKIEMVVDWTMDENLISCTAINIVGQTTADAEIEVKCKFLQFKFLTFIRQDTYFSILLEISCIKKLKLYYAKAKPVLLIRRTLNDLDDISNIVRFHFYECKMFEIFAHEFLRHHSGRLSHSYRAKTFPPKK